MGKRRAREGIRPEIPIAPMIDCVFLLLVYFMVTSSLEREEADLNVALPGKASTETALLQLDEQMVAFNTEGDPMLNGAVTDSGNCPAYGTLRGRLRFFKKAAERAGTRPSLLIVPRPETPHAHLVRVLDATSAAGIEAVQFGKL